MEPKNMTRDNLLHQYANAYAMSCVSFTPVSLCVQLHAELLRRLNEADALRKENEELRKENTALHKIVDAAKYALHRGYELFFYDITMRDANDYFGQNRYKSGYFAAKSNAFITKVKLREDSFESLVLELQATETEAKESETSHE